METIIFCARSQISHNENLPPLIQANLNALYQRFSTVSKLGHVTFLMYREMMTAVTMCQIEELVKYSQQLVFTILVSNKTFVWIPSNSALKKRSSEYKKHGSNCEVVNKNAIFVLTLL